MSEIEPDGLGSVVLQAAEAVPSQSCLDCGGYCLLLNLAVVVKEARAVTLVLTAFELHVVSVHGSRVGPGDLLPPDNRPTFRPGCPQCDVNVRTHFTLMVRGADRLARGVLKIQSLHMAKDHEEGRW
ncbi:hypothetical protein [Streptomyces luteireticuli]|uniref:Uncharacterized protein n=1 Tax=Streptomyces luteireticuli TaxID=173858 RepID=A0ABN0YR18_9ACTN